ncbi:hypothetical protein J41TS12_40990 [Paenibacillus antibioticophila]|uniref:Uncharacterized protein n=1 Tax=Paenibacillus antibioticophila TaxID=1274374 RepID=A0A920CIZ4_9BACL|nr:hypothetical protein J41TS12_40990 [Paenibacillus antibioticophila]
MTEAKISDKEDPSSLIRAAYAHIEVSWVVREEFPLSIPSTMKDPKGSFWLA